MWKKQVVLDKGKVRQCTPGGVLWFARPELQNDKEYPFCRALWNLEPLLSRISIRQLLWKARSIENWTIQMKKKRSKVQRRHVNGKYWKGRCLARSKPEGFKTQTVWRKCHPQALYYTRIIPWTFWRPLTRVRGCPCSQYSYKLNTDAEAFSISKCPHA